MSPINLYPHKELKNNNKLMTVMKKCECILSNIIQNFNKT